MADFSSSNSHYDSEVNPEAMSLEEDNYSQGGHPSENYVGLERSTGVSAPVDADSQANFYENLAFTIPPEILNRLASRLLEEIDSDKIARQEWETTCNLGIKYTGIKVEEFRQKPFIYACGAVDNTLINCLISLFSVVMSELFPDKGPASIKPIGIPSPQIVDQAERAELFINNFLTNTDSDYYSDSEKLMWEAIFFGVGFRKGYQNTLLQQPALRSIEPFNCILNSDATNIRRASRFTEIEYLTRQEILLYQREHTFIEFELPPPDGGNEPEKSQIQTTIENQEGVDSSAAEKRSTIMFYNIDVMLGGDNGYEEEEIEDLEEDFIPRPYTIKICVATEKIVSIKRNWKPEDTNYSSISNVTVYKLFPGFGAYGLGLVHLLGSNGIAATSILRQTIDVATLANFPGGLIADDAGTNRISKNNISPGPCEFQPINTNDRRIQDCVMMMPYGEPSSTLVSLRQQLRQEAQELLSTLQTMLPKLGANAPTGTVLALLDVASKPQSAMIKSLRHSLGQELKSLYKLLGQYLPNTPYPFGVPGKQAAVMGSDFNDSLQIVPVADSNATTSTHRILLNDAVLKLAGSAPQLHNLYAVYKRFYTSLNVPNVDEILISPPAPMSLDAQSENMLMLSDKPVKAAIFQDDDAHILTHKADLNNPLIQANPMRYIAFMQHIQSHEALKVYKQMEKTKYSQMLQQQMFAAIQQGMNPQWAQMHMQQQLSNFQIPDLTPEQQMQVMQMPMIQNQVTAKNVEEIKQQQAQAAQAAADAKASQPIDPSKVMLEDIAQRREAAHLKNEETHEKVQTDLIKAQLSHDAEMSRTEAQREIATEKNSVDLVIAENKNHGGLK